MWDLRQWTHCIFSDESRFSLYHSDDRVRVRRRQGERLIDACVQPNDGSRGLSVMVWGEIHHGGGVNRGGWSHEPASVHPDPEESNIDMGDGGVWT